MFIDANRATRFSSVRSEMFNPSHFAPDGAKKIYPTSRAINISLLTELTSLRHGSLYFVLQKTGVAGLSLRSTANATNPIV
jgi:hypothetical protein